MYKINARNVNSVLPKILKLITSEGVKTSSRNGDVLKLPAPLLVQYRKPWERVLFSPKRDANPFFHLMESLWMLAGREDVEFPAYFAKNLANYSDDQKVLNGAYGYRWNGHFGVNGGGHVLNQLDEIVKIFKKDPNSRRVVLSMWDGNTDLTNQKSKDIPCNTHAYFAINQGKLDMTVCNRSNDVIWGLCGANAVHFSILQDYIFRKLEDAGVNVSHGSYYQFTNNAHCYVDNEVYKKTVSDIEDLKKWSTAYEDNHEFLTVSQDYNLFQHFPMIDFDKDMHTFFKLFESTKEFSVDEAVTNSFKDIHRLMNSYMSYKSKDKEASLYHVSQCNTLLDWKLACELWLNRRKWN